MVSLDQPVGRTKFYMRASNQRVTPAKPMKNFKFKLSLELENRLTNERLEFNIIVHVYLFGPKYKSKDERPAAFAEVRKIVEENFGATISQIEIREVRDIAVNNLQYCATFKLKSDLDCPVSKRMKTAE